MKSENPAPPREVSKFRRLAREAAKHHFGSYPKRIVHRPSGLTNFVFTFANSDGEFVIRISPDPSRLNLFIKEQWAEKAAGDAGVPVPQILEVGFELIGFPYMISGAVSGIEATDHPDRFSILKQMGRHAAVINTVKTQGFGQTFDWSGNKLSFNSSFGDYLNDEYKYQEKLKSLLKHKMITEAVAKKVRAVFAAAAKERVKPVLNHGDIRLKNVIVSEKGEINAIIDWEGCTSNIAPAWELSLAIHDLGIDGRQHFLEGYGISDKKWRESLPLIRAFNLTNYASAVEDIAAAKDKRRMEQYRLRLSGDLELFSF